MAFEDVLGQDIAVRTLRNALASGRVHHAYRFEGPEGVGKERVAFELAAELVAGNDPVQRRRVLTLEPEPPQVPRHPDVVLIQRGLYAKLLDAAEGTGISVEQIRRLVLARSGFPPHEGNALVFLVRDAEELTVSAANALLKTLEEPGPRVFFILLTSRPRRLLDTIRSRTLGVRFGPLPDSDLATILARNNASTELVPLAQGSAGRALRLADSEASATRTEFVRAALAALDAPDLTAALALAEGRPDDRRELRNQLEALAQELGLRSRATLATDPATAQTAAHRFSHVLHALDALDRNAAPALALEAMVLAMRGM